jgi:hypothetical protein
MTTVKLNKEFFINDEVLFVGYSNRMIGFCKKMYQAFTNNGIKVYPLNSNKNTDYDVKVYNSLEEMAVIPRTAFILFNEDSEIKVIKKLANKGVIRILFQDSKATKKEIIEECGKMGIETLVACPLMKFGKGLHRFHGFCTGVR